MGGKQHKKSRDSAPEGASINKAGLVIAIVTLVALFGAVVFLGEPPPPPSPDTATTGPSPEPEDSPVEQWMEADLRAIPVDPGRDFIRGPVDAPVTIVEFTDFECPFCKIAHGYIDEVLGRYPNDVRLVYKNYPLDMACNGDMARQLHPRACKAAIMARCAGAREPELFWRFHDDIFETDAVDDEWLDVKAAELGVADEAFESCVTGRGEFDAVRADIELASSIGVHATPSIYINGRQAPSYEIPALVEVVDHILGSD